MEFFSSVAVNHTVLAVSADTHEEYKVAAWWSPLSSSFTFQAHSYSRPPHDGELVVRYSQESQLAALVGQTSPSLLT